MKIAIMGTGGVGGYYGGLLARTGHDVVFIARGAHLQAIREQGLRVKSVLGDFTVSPARATDNPAEVGPVDLIIFATKTYDTDTAAQAIKPMIGQDTVVVPLQNGIDAAERIGSLVGMEHLLGGVTWIWANIIAPGVIGHHTPLRRIAIGELDGAVTPRLRKVYEALHATGIEVEMSEDIAKLLWTKFVLIALMSALGSLTRVHVDEYRQVPETREMLAGALGEVVAVARARGIDLEAGMVEKSLEFIDSYAPGLKPSMQRDVEAGRRSELESMVGVIPRLGGQSGVPTPVMKMAYALLKPGDLQAQGK